MTDAPVTRDRILIAMDAGLHNVNPLAVACRQAQVPFFVACALMEKESGGKNLWGSDRGGTFAELPDDEWPKFAVTKETYEIFEHYVVTLGRTSNGVGPAQITWRGFFPDMRKKGMKPWDPHDNMLYGLQMLHSYRIAHGGQSWEACGTAYNGAKSYGVDFAAKVREWKQRLDVG